VVFPFPSTENELLKTGINRNKNDVRLRARIQRSSLSVSTNGGVLVSTEGLRTGSHAEDDSLASLKIESKNQTPIKNWLSRLN